MFFRFARRHPIAMGTAEVAERRLFTSGSPAVKHPIIVFFLEITEMQRCNEIFTTGTPTSIPVTILNI